MLSLQRLFSKDDRFFELLEASAMEARHSVQALNRVLTQPSQVPSLQAFHASKEEDKRITEQINQALVTMFVSQLDRDEIEHLSAALYKIPKTIEKFTERYLLSLRFVGGLEFGRHATLLDRATKAVEELVRLLRQMDAGVLTTAKEINARLQQVELEADGLIMEKLQDLYSGRHDPKKVLAVRDLYEVLEKVIDRCRDVGGLVSHMVLKRA